MRLAIGLAVALAAAAAADAAPGTYRVIDRIKGPDGGWDFLRIDTGSVRTTWATAGTRPLAVDPETGRVYLPTAEFEPAAQGERPKTVAGSFRILVMER
jgi:hypothetical protein